MYNILNKIREAFNVDLRDFFKPRKIFSSWKFWFFIYFVFRFSCVLAHKTGLDTHIYLDALDRAAHHGNDAAFFAGSGFVYTPFALLLFKPLYFLHNEKLAYIIIALISFLCLYLIYEKTFSFLKLFPKEKLISFLLTLAIVERFIASNIKIGQVNLIYYLFILLSFFAYMNKKHAQSSFFLCFSMCFKLTPIVFLPYYFVKKQYKTVFLCGTFFIILNLAASVLLGGQEYLRIMTSYLNAISDSSQIMTFESRNHSFLTFLFRLFDFYQLPITLYPKLIWFVSFVATYLSFLFWTYKSRSVHLSYEQKSRLDSLDLSLLLGFMLVFSPITWGHYFVILIFPLVVISVSLIKRYREQKKLTCLSLFYLFLLLNSIGTVSTVCNYLLHTKEFLSGLIILNLSVFIYMFWKRYQLFSISATKRDTQL